MRKKDIHIDSTYTNTTEDLFFRIIRSLDGGRWEVEILGGLPLLTGVGMGRIQYEIQDTWRNTRQRTVNSRSIKRPITEEEFAKLREIRIEELNSRRIKRLQTQSQILVESSFNIYKGSWVHSSILSWKVYSDIDQQEKETSIDEHLQELLRMRRGQNFNRYYVPPIQRVALQHIPVQNNADEWF